MKWIRVVVFSSLIVTVLLATFHFWITNHSKNLLKKFIHHQSNGTLSFDATKVTLKYWERRVEFQNIVLSSMPANNKNSQYSISCPSLVFQLQHIRPLLFGKALLIDSIVCQSPSIILIKKLNQNQKHLKIAEEWGHINKGLQKALRKLYLKRFQINNASFEMHESGNSSAEPFKINHIYFVVDQLEADNEKKHPEMQAKKMALSIYRQHIILPNKKQHLLFREFNLNTATGRILIDSCTVFNATIKDSSTYKITTDTLLLDKVDFDTLYETGLITAKSMLLARPTIDLHLYAYDSLKKNKKKSIQQMVSELSGDIALEQLLLEDAVIDIKATHQKNTNTFHFDDVSLKAGDIEIGYALNRDPISIGYIDLIIKKYRGNNNDSSYIIDMEKLHLQKEMVLISNISMLPANKQHTKEQNSIYVKEISISNLSIPDLLFYKTISANNIQLVQPNIHFTAAVKKNETPAKVNTNKLNDSAFQVKNLEIIEGNIYFNNNKGSIIAIQNLHLSSGLSNILSTNDPASLLQQLHQLDFKKLQLKTPGFQIEADKSDFTGKNKDLHFKKIFFKTPDQKMKGILEQVTLESTPMKNESNNIEINKISWGKGHIQLQLNKEHSEKKTTQGNASPSLIARNIQGNNTTVEMMGSNGKGSTFLKKLQLSAFTTNAGKKPHLENLSLTAEKTSFENSGNQITARKIVVEKSQHIHLSDANIFHSKNRDTIHALIPAISMTANINDLINGKKHIKQFLLNNPVLTIQKDNTLKNTTAPQKPLPSFTIDHLSAKNAAVNLLLTKDSNKNNILFKESTITINELLANENQYSIKNSSVQLNNLMVYKNDSAIFSGSPHMEGIAYSKKDTIWTGSFQQLNIPKGFAHIYKKDNTVTKLNWNSIGLKNIQLRNDALKNTFDWAASNQDAGLQLTKMNIVTPKQQFYTNGIYSNAIKELIEIDSFSLKPILSRDELIEGSAWQTEYIQFQASNIQLHQLDPRRFQTDSTFRLHHIAIDQPSIDIYRDKQKPFHHGFIKPLPTNALKRMNLSVSIDSITTSNGTVLYQEKSDKTGLVGSVHFTALNAKVSNINNHHFSNTDSLKLRATALFMGVAPLQLRLRESYLDSLGGFLLTASLSKTDLNILNKMTVPAASVKINSGTLDTLFMRVIGREYISLGNMNMYYHQLQVQFLNKGREGKKTLLTGLLTFAANSFVIKKHNTKRKGMIYYTRDREKAVFNYLAKMALSGAASSAGAKSNKKYARQYVKALKQKNLPPIHLED